MVFLAPEQTPERHLNRFVGQFLLFPAPEGAPRGEYNTTRKFRDIFSQLCSNKDADVGLLCVKWMVDGTHLTSRSFLEKQTI